MQQLGIGGDFHYDNVRGATHDAVRHVLDAHAAQRCQPRSRAMASRQRVPLHLRGVRRLPLQRDGTASTSMPASSCRTSACSATTTSTTGPTSRPMCPPIRRGSSTASGCRPFPSDKLKIEFWIINGWQSYGMFNDTPGLGMQVLLAAHRRRLVLSNDYWGYDYARHADRARASTATTASRSSTTISRAPSGQVRLLVDVGRRVRDRAAGSTAPQDRAAAGAVLPRLHGLRPDLVCTRTIFGLTLGGGAINNPGRYLVLLPPINGATVPPARPTSPPARATNFKRGTRRSRSTSCRTITSRSAPSSTTARRACRISSGGAASRHRRQHRVRRIGRAGLEPGPP